MLKPRNLFISDLKLLWNSLKNVGKVNEVTSTRKRIFTSTRSHYKRATLTTTVFGERMIRKRYPNDDGLLSFCVHTESPAGILNSYNALVGICHRKYHKTKESLQKPSPNLKDNPWTIPNLLCMIRMGSSPILAYLIVNCQYELAVGLFAFAGVTDLLDGWIARIFPSQSSMMGSFLDPLADKILVGTLFLSLTYMELIPVYLTALIIVRDVGLIAAGFYIRYQSLDPPITFTRYFDVTHATAKLEPTFLSKINTGIQLGLVGSTLISTVLPYDMTFFLTALWISTACTTIGSAVSYMFAKDTVKFLRQKRMTKSEGKP